MKGSFSQSFDKLEIFPIGSIYTSINSTNPATLFGGTWEQIQGRFLLSASSSYTAGGTGGASTINLSHVHSTGNHTLTVSQIPSHSHSTTERVAGYNGWPYGTINNQIYVWDWSGCLNPDSRAYTGYMGNNSLPPTGNTGGGGAHNHGNTGSNLSSSQSIMPPYLTVYMWKRTA